MTTAADLYNTHTRHQHDPLPWEALTRREQAGWEVAAGLVEEVRELRDQLREDCRQPARGQIEAGIKAADMVTAQALDVILDATTERGDR